MLSQSDVQNYINNTGVVISSKNQLEDLLGSDKPLTAITFTAEAACAVDHVSSLISKHCETLRSIVLDGSLSVKCVIQHSTIEKKNGVSYVYHEHEYERLARAINNCKKLRILKIENYKDKLTERLHLFTLDLAILPNLEQLSYANTYINDGQLGHNYIVEMFSRIVSKLQHLKYLNIADAIFFSDALYILFKALSENRSLTSLILGHKELADLRSFSYLRTLIQTLLQNNILHIGYQPPQTDNRSNEEAPNLITQLQEFIQEKNKDQKLTELKIMVIDENDLFIELIAGRILLHHGSLQKLSIKILNTNKRNPEIQERIDSLVAALKLCTQLQSFFLLNFQGTFSWEIDKIVDAIASLPIKRLSFNKTYLGTRGIVSLKTMLETNAHLKRLNLTLAGLMNGKCYKNLSVALNNNSSLQLLILGKSPMHSSWMIMLKEVVVQKIDKIQPGAPKKSPLKINWDFSPAAVMEEKRQIMVTELLFSQLFKDICVNSSDSIDVCTDADSNELENAWRELQSLEVEERPVITQDHVVRNTNSFWSQIAGLIKPRDVELTPLTASAASSSNSYGTGVISTEMAATSSQKR